MKKLLSLLLTLALALSLAACGGGACEKLELNKTEVTLTKEGDTFGLKVTTDPEDTTDDVEFESSDEDVATVSSRGLITAAGAGHATITVTCGDETEYCEVTCDFSKSPDDGRDDPDPTEDPTDQPTQNACNACGGDGICDNCGGDPRCHECDGTGDCRRCDGVGEITCPDCGGNPPSCKECGGDGLVEYGRGGSYTCYSCMGDGVYCKTCKYGDVDCSECDGDGECQDCKGKKYICYDCEDGYCAKCNGTGNAPYTENPGGNDPVSDDYEDCPYCTDGLCPDCNFGTCKNSYCYNGKVLCSSCDGSGDCPSCAGLGENLTTGKDCSRCSNGDCKKCGGEGKVTCSTCDGDYYCDKCNDGECPYCDGLGFLR